MGLGGLITKTDKPSDNLLPRFAAASEWLAENHPDAPRLPGWCWIFDDGYIAEDPYTASAPWDQDDGPSSVTNPAACLSGAVVWAMEVERWWSPGGISHDICTAHSVYSWAITTLESICESLGREG